MHVGVIWSDGVLSLSQKDGVSVTGVGGDWVSPGAGHQGHHTCKYLGLFVPAQQKQWTPTSGEVRVVYQVIYHTVYHPLKLPCCGGGGLRTNPGGTTPKTAMLCFSYLFF